MAETAKGDFKWADKSRTKVKFAKNKNGKYGFIKKSKAENGKDMHEVIIIK